LDLWRPHERYEHNLKAQQVDILEKETAGEPSTKDEEFFSRPMAIGLVEIPPPQLAQNRHSRAGQLVFYCPLCRDYLPYDPDKRHKDYTAMAPTTVASPRCKRQPHLPFVYAVTGVR
jgi:hypothetical protein